MQNRRDFLKEFAGAAGGILFVGCGLASAAGAVLQSGTSSRRREVTVNGRRVKTVDIHCHAQVPEVWDVIKDFDLGQSLRGQLDGPQGEGLNLNNAEWDHERACDR